MFVLPVRTVFAVIGDVSRIGNGFNRPSPVEERGTQQSRPYFQRFVFYLFDAIFVTSVYDFISLSTSIKCECIQRCPETDRLVGVARMTTDPNATVPEREIPPWFRVVQVLLLATFVVAIYLLGLSMVHHRFFKGSRVDRFGHVTQ
jgi:hypothetical protein